MDGKELLLIEEALERLTTALDCNEQEILDCLVGTLISEKEVGEIKDFLDCALI
jgi:hypothetical protein